MLILHIIAVLFMFFAIAMVIVFANTGRTTDGHLVGCIITCSVAFLLAFYSGVFCTTNTYEDEAYDELKCYIASLERDSRTEGTFFLGCGHIDDTDYYYYYKEVAENTYSLERVARQYAYIFETDDYKPQLRHIKKAHESDRYWLYVPVGTIVREYKA